MLDAFDRKILAILQKDARTPQREIGEAVNLSSSAVNRRIAALERAASSPVRSPWSIRRKLAGPSRSLSA